MDTNREIGLTILGATGSIGTQALDIVRSFPERFRVRALTAHSAVDTLIAQAREFRPECIVVSDPKDCDRVLRALAGSPVEVLSGEEGLIAAALWPGAQVVLTALVGAAGVPPTVAAVRSGRRVALANKEALVVAGSIIMPLAREHGAEIVPVDSEHSAIFQCLTGEPGGTIEKLILTASGGPFRERPADSFASVTREEALRHPTWNMGAKITIDSATMMNKGLEVIEAHWLFDVSADDIQVVVHPQSVIHSIVQFRDGSAKAQLGAPDMRVPIQYALTYPDRWPAAHPRLDWTALGTLSFEAPDGERFPCLALAFQALRTGGAAPAVLNAANEEAVTLFLENRIPFVDIAHLIESTLLELAEEPGVTIEDLLDADDRARRRVLELANVRVH